MQTQTERQLANDQMHIVPINPAAFGYCSGYVVITREAGKQVCIGVFAAHERQKAVDFAQRELEMRRAAN